MAAKMMMTAETVIPTALGDRAPHRRDAVGRGAFAVDRDGLFAKAEPGASGKPFDVDCAQRRFDDVSNDAGQDQAREEEQAGAEQARQEGENFIGQRGNRGQDPRQAERLERGDQPDQPNDPIAEPTQFLADAVAHRAGIALEDRHLVDQPADRPLHRLGDEVGDDQDQDREQDARPPLRQLLLPIGCRSRVLVHDQSPPVRLFHLPPVRRMSSQ